VAWHCTHTHTHTHIHTHTHTHTNTVLLNKLVDLIGDKRTALAWTGTVHSYLCLTDNGVYFIPSGNKAAVTTAQFPLFLPAFV